MRENDPIHESGEPIPPEKVGEAIAEALAEYTADLRLENLDLKGKHLLDVGSEGTALFARGMRSAGVDVVSVDSGDYVHIPGFDDIPFVRAIGQRLPFGDGTFDMVISHCSLPISANARDLPGAPDDAWLNPELKKAAVRDSITEMVRVAGARGEVRFSPIHLRPETHDGDWFKERFAVIHDVLDELADAGMEVRLQPIRDGDEFCAIITKK